MAELSPGLELLTSPPVSRLSIAYMSVALDDPNLVHVEPEVASASELPGVIAHGAFSVAYIAAAATRAHGVRAVRGLSVRLHAPLFPGQSVQVRSQDAESILVAGGERMDLDAVAIPSGVILARGSVSVHSR